MSILPKAAAVAGVLLFACPAHASNVIVAPDSGDWSEILLNMADVFGKNFSLFDSYASADVKAVFSSANRFIYLEGSDYSDITLATYLKTNAKPIADWVTAGGHLLIQSAGEHVPNEVIFAGVSLTRTPTTPNLSGTFTAAGDAAMTAFYVPASHASGASLAEDVITGAGLTAYMTGDDNGGMIVAGKSYGRGSILFSALTDSVFHYPAPGGLLGDTRELVDDTIVLAATGVGPSAVPLPASGALYGGALLTLAGLSLATRRRPAIGTGCVPVSNLT